MYCYKCGAQIPDESIFCSHCGTKVGGEPVSEAGASPKHKLIIDRASQIYLINPAIKVTIDNNIRLSIENGGSQEIELDEGTHHIECSASMRTTKADYTLSQDTLITIGFSRMSGKIVLNINPA